MLGKKAQKTPKKLAIFYGKVYNTLCEHTV